MTKRKIETGCGTHIQAHGKAQVRIWYGESAGLIFEPEKMLKAMVEVLNETRNNDKGKGGKTNDVKIDPVEMVIADIISGTIPGSGAASEVGSSSTGDRSAGLGGQLQQKVSVDSGREEPDPWERLTGGNSGR